MPRDLTRAEDITEEIRCHRGMLEYWRRMADGAETSRTVAAQRAIIDVATATIAEAELKHAQAPGMIVAYERKIHDARQRLATWNNRGGVQKLTKLQKQLAEMSADLADLAKSDPETAEMMKSTLANLKL